MESNGGGGGGGVAVSHQLPRLQPAYAPGPPRSLEPLYHAEEDGPEPLSYSPPPPSPSAYAPGPLSYSPSPPPPPPLRYPLQPEEYSGEYSVSTHICDE